MLCACPQFAVQQLACCCQCLTGSQGVAELAVITDWLADCVCACTQASLFTGKWMIVQ